MNTHPTHTAAAATVETLEIDTADRVAAIELFLQQLVFVLDVSGALSADALDRWVNTARGRMIATNSATPAQVLALIRLQRKVQQ